jgi:hypothetical protein
VIINFKRRKYGILLVLHPYMAESVNLSSAFKNATGIFLSLLELLWKIVMKIKSRINTTLLKGCEV